MMGFPFAARCIVMNDSHTSKHLKIKKKDYSNKWLTFGDKMYDFFFLCGTKKKNCCAALSPRYSRYFHHYCIWEPFAFWPHGGRPWRKGHFTYSPLLFLFFVLFLLLAFSLFSLLFLFFVLFLLLFSLLFLFFVLFLLLFSLLFLFFVLFLLLFSLLLLVLLVLLNAFFWMWKPRTLPVRTP